MDPVASNLPIQFAKQNMADADQGVPGAQPVADATVSLPSSQTSKQS